MTACVLTPPVYVEEVKVAMVERRKAIRCMGFGVCCLVAAAIFSSFCSDPVNKFGTTKKPGKL